MIDRIEVERGRRYQGDPLTKVVHVKVTIHVGAESFTVDEDDMIEATYRTQLADLLRAAARELEDA